MAEKKPTKKVKFAPKKLAAAPAIPGSRNKAGSANRPTAFKPGQSGNPAGRAKRTPEEFELIAACRNKTPAALAVIERIMVKGSSERNKLAAATAIIDRAYGKPTQPIGGDEDRPLQVVGTIRLVRA